MTRSFSKAQVEGLINKRPKVEGGQIYVGNDLNKVLIYAENEAKAMGDEYVSVEHLFLCHVKTAEQGYEGTVPGLMGSTRE